LGVDLAEHRIGPAYDEASARQRRRPALVSGGAGGCRLSPGIPRINDDPHSGAGLSFRDRQSGREHRLQRETHRKQKRLALGKSHG
jgi:hypothetical protein